MSLSSWKERTKLGLLALAYSVCLLTWFTSDSAGLEKNRELPPLRVPPQVCDAYCSSASSSTAGDGSAQATNPKTCRTCQSIVQRVEKRINISPQCLWAEQQVALCEVEWCTTSITASAAQECRTECQQVRFDLKNCIDAALQTEMRKQGLL